MRLKAYYVDKKAKKCDVLMHITEFLYLCVIRLYVFYL